MSDLHAPFDVALSGHDQALAWRWRRFIGLAIAALFGVAAAGATVAVSGLATRYLVALMLAIAGLVALPLLGTRQRARDLMVIAIALGLSVGLSISFMHRMIIPGRYVPFMGGAEGVTASLTLVATVLYYGQWVFERYFYGVHRPLRVYQPLVWPAVLFMVSGVLSMVSAIDMPLVYLQEFRLFCLLAVIIVVMNFTPRELNIYLLALAGSVLLQAALAVTQYVTGRDFGLRVFGEAALELAAVDFQLLYRPTGLFGDPNIMAYFFEINAPMMLALFLVTRDRLERLLYLAATVAALAGIFVSLSRAAWATVPLTFGFIILTVYGRRLLTLRVAIIAIGLLGVAAVAATFLYPMIEHRLLGDDRFSAAQRMPLNLAALSIIHRFPLFGVGMNNFAISFTKYDTSGAAWVIPDVDYVVHNLFLLVWGEVGTVGFAAFLWYFGSVFLAAGRLPRFNFRARAIALGISAGLAAQLMHGMVDPGFMVNLTISQLIAAQIGVVGCLCLAARRNGPAKGPAG